MKEEKLQKYKYTAKASRSTRITRPCLPFFLFLNFHHFYKSLFVTQPKGTYRTPRECTFPLKLAYRSPLPPLLKVMELPAQSAVHLSRLTLLPQSSSPKRILFYL